MKITQSLKQILPKLNFVPQSKPASVQDIESIQQFIDKSKRLFVLTGAGISTESGIPDYRSETVGLYARTDRRPMQYQEFLNSASGRQRYWARNYVGWKHWSSFKPNECHNVIAKMETIGRLHWLVTQNVDTLHTKAGSEKITELHGCSNRVVCLSCPSVMTRQDLQKVFKELNPDFRYDTLEIAPDGDVIIPDELVTTFQVPPCPSCGGILKPEVIFFGDNVPRPTVELVFNKLKESDSVLVAGSSLYVFSSYRFVNRAHEWQIPIAVINIGTTRADKLIDLKVSARCGEILPKLKL